MVPVVYLENDGEQIAINKRKVLYYAFSIILTRCCQRDLDWRRFRRSSSRDRRRSFIAPIAADSIHENEVGKPLKLES